MELCSEVFIDVDEYEDAEDIGKDIQEILGDCEINSSIEVEIIK